MSIIQTHLRNLGIRAPVEYFIEEEDKRNKEMLEEWFGLSQARQAKILKELEDFEAEVSSLQKKKNIERVISWSHPIVMILSIVIFFCFRNHLGWLGFPFLYSVCVILIALPFFWKYTEKEIAVNRKFQEFRRYYMKLVQNMLDALEAQYPFLKSE